MLHLPHAGPEGPDQQFVTGMSKLGGPADLRRMSCRFSIADRTWNWVTGVHFEICGVG
jgi:hypothetical protein